MDEVWKQVLGFEGKYDISNFGRLKNVQRGSGIVTGRILAPGKNLGGYHQYTLGKSGGRHTAHLLVMQAFVGSRPDGMQINHKNGIKADNRLENLEYMSAADNKLHSCRVLGRARGESHGNAKITDDDVREIRLLGSTTSLTHAEIGLRFGITNKNVGYIIRKQAWPHVV